jgi:predicted alpha/beta superfamily hydrolase
MVRTETATGEGSILHTYDRFKTPGYRYPERKLQVFLPRLPPSSALYPVLYMNDGHTVFCKGGLANQSWNLADTLDRLNAQGRMEKIIVVAVFPVNRNREYTHTQWFDREDCCELQDYADCLAKQIKPFIDKHYPTRNDPGENIIAGASHGGLAAFYIANRYPEQFGFCFAMSPSFWVGLDDATEFPDIKTINDKILHESELIAMLKSTLQSRGRPRIYMDWGLVRHGGPHNRLIEERAKARGREMAGLLQRVFGYRMGQDLLFYEDPEGEHQETSWGNRIPRALEWFHKRRSSQVL